MAACGQTKAQLLHWIHFSASHIGTITATPRFSKAAVPAGMVPSAYGMKALTGRVSPAWAFTMSATS